MNYEQINQDLADKSAQEIIDWAVAQGGNPIVTTNFGPQEAVILHMAVQAKADIPVVWIDSGYNTSQTYKIAEEIIEKLNLNVHVFTPRVSAARCDAALGGIPSVDDPRHPEFTEQFKLEPFRRAMAEMAPSVWLTAVRSEQTEFRSNMEIASEGIGGCIKVAPLLEWTTAQMAEYLEANGLPSVEKYFDPTKALGNRECGLHTKI